MLLEFVKESSAKLKSPLSLSIKIILMLAIINSVYFKIWHVLFVNLLLLFLVFVPYFLQKSYKIHIPGEFEFLILIFILFSFFLGDIRGLFIQAFLGVAMGFVGFMIMFILYSTNKIRTNYLLTALFSFGFAVSLGVIMEIIKYAIKIFLGYGFDASNYIFTLNSLILVSIGALAVSLVGFIYLKYNRGRFLKSFMVRFIKKNPNLFVEQTDSPEEVLKLIKEGEGRRLEFKSTLRMNLHTHKIDKNVEHAVLKSIIGFLNSNGGTLLVGVSDKGEILGIEKDRFENKDKFNLNFANLIKSYIGREYLPFLNFELVQVEEKHILKVDVLRSNKPIFLKIENREEFYIRAGASTTLISGSNLLEYIEHRFKKKP